MRAPCRDCPLTHIPNMKAHKRHALTLQMCVQFVMRHAPGARALKFVRRLPLFKGLGDNNLVSVASRMREKVYQVSTQPIPRTPILTVCLQMLMSVCLYVYLSGI